MDTLESELLLANLSVLTVGSMGIAPVTALGISGMFSVASGISKLLPKTQHNTYLIFAANRRSPAVLQISLPRIGVVYEDVAGINPEDFEPVIVKFVQTKDNWRIAGALRITSKKGLIGLKPKTTYSFVEQRIPIKITKSELGRVDVEPEKELEPGEYAIVLRPRWQSKEVSDKDIRVFSAAASLLNIMWDFSIARSSADSAQVSDDLDSATERRSGTSGPTRTPETTAFASNTAKNQNEVVTIGVSPTGQSNTLPIYGKIEEIKWFQKVYVHADNENSRERILNALLKDKALQVVGDPNEAQILLEYKVLSHESSIEQGSRHMNEKSQLTASYFKDGKRVTAWSDTSEFAQSSQLIGFRTQYSEIKLASSAICG